LSKHFIFSIILLQTKYKVSRLILIIFKAFVTILVKMAFSVKNQIFGSYQV